MRPAGRRRTDPRWTVRWRRGPGLCDYTPAVIATVVHLHGLGSSPRSPKALALARRLEPLGVRYRVPDLEVPSFERITLSAVIERAAAELAAAGDGPLALVGSSFGGLAALHLADRRPRVAARVERMALLAPALDLGEGRERQLDGDWLERWRSDGFLELPHSASGSPRPVHYGLVEDLRRYDSYAVRVGMPILIYHGRRDESVPYQQSVRFADRRPNVTLRLLDTDHSLDGEMDAVADGLVEFFGVGRR